MLDYTIFILEKVSFNLNLFSKELQKALKILIPADIMQLQDWFYYFTKDKKELLIFESYFLKFKIEANSFSKL
ncbi:hypothetical protein SL053_001633 [Flavobacterium psychrophilum]|uniref:Uncharacterized protein n=2 Tax=Flavobacterium psychrophilum TaxID=96345 RepID=A6GZP2_FLAPJ|nr:hypothetical protein [Flavobacterium psychrophilum]AIG30266.1 hypothetical protein IA03_07185 [Flavobacterium psychrophilum]AIG32541.1 hypothetical protein IA01_07185 [Flavobacterium psychrophilum]AIG34696.1 hypothetical protein IA02_06595 [Flavobacterium psychrophilum]AIG37060.1 hypothetical protein IA04_07090 [Flavobacterium psychrophilum]AIG39324.1 hypothetical protein IA05_07175 [Flavobacterium psychrophilum]